MSNPVAWYLGVQPQFLEAAYVFGNAPSLSERLMVRSFSDSMAVTF
jgi:hypothetical protein